MATKAKTNSGTSVKTIDNEIPNGICITGDETGAKIINLVQTGKPDFGEFNFPSRASASEFLKNNRAWFALGQR